MSQEISVFAETTFRNRFRKFGIKRDDRRRHMYLIGKTGMGKSTILENMIVGDIRSGHGVCVVDPHGDLAEKVIKFVPSSRINDVIYFNPADYEYPIAFNVVEQVEPHLRHLVASGLIGVFQKLWADSWGPRLEYILRNTILAILDYPGSTLLAVTRMLSDKKFRKKIIEKIEDPVVRAFWVNEFAGYADKFASEAVSPIQNKVGQFLSTSLIRNIVGQVKSTINMREIMDSGKILIVNLSKGRIGEDSSALLGNMVITKIQLAAMSRVDVPEEERRDFYLYIDEFQNFTTDSFANILSEARKYHLNLILAHQYIEQLGDVVRNAVFGNVGTLVVFRVGAADAEELEPEFTPTFLGEDILNLPKYEFYLKLMIDGVASEPFSARGLPPLRKDEETDNVDKLVAVSRERYAKDKATVEDKIARWHSSDEDDKGAANNTNSNQTNTSSRPAPAPRDFRPQTNTRPTEERRPRSEFSPSSKTFSSNPVQSDVPAPVTPIIDTKPSELRSNTNLQYSNTSDRVNNSRPSPESTFATARSSEQKYTADCSRCGRETKLSFKPDGVRPIFCKDCLLIAREEKKKEVENRKKLKDEEIRRLRQKAEQSIARSSVPNNKQTRVVTSEANVAGISLSEVLNMNPVNFRGQELKKNEAREERIGAILPSEAREVPEAPAVLEEKPAFVDSRDSEIPLRSEDEFDIEIDRTIEL